MKQLAEHRPMVSLDGTIHYGLTEKQKRLIESYGFDPNEAVVLRDDSDHMLIKIENIHYLLKETDT